MARTKQTARLLPEGWVNMSARDRRAWIDYGKHYAIIREQPGAQFTAGREDRQRAADEAARVVAERQAKAQSVQSAPKSTAGSDTRWAGFDTNTNIFGEIGDDEEDDEDDEIFGEPSFESVMKAQRDAQWAEQNRASNILAQLSEIGPPSQSVVPPRVAPEKQVRKKVKAKKSSGSGDNQQKREKQSSNRERRRLALLEESELNKRRFESIQERNAKELADFRARKAAREAQTTQSSLPVRFDPILEPVPERVEFVPDIELRNADGTDADVPRQDVEFDAEEYLRPDEVYGQLADFFDNEADMQSRREAEERQRKVIADRVVEDQFQQDLFGAVTGIVADVNRENRRLATAQRRRERDRERKRGQRNALKPSAEQQEAAREERAEAKKERRRLAAKAKRDAAREARGPPEEREPRKRGPRPGRPARAYVPKFMPFVVEDEAKVADGISDRALVISRMHQPYVGETTYYRFMGVAHRMAQAAYPGIIATHDRVKTLARFIARQEEMLRTLVIDYDALGGNANLTSLDQIRAVDILWKEIPNAFLNENVRFTQGFQSLINHPRTFLTAREPGEGDELGPLIADSALFKRVAAILTLLRFPSSDGRPIGGQWTSRNLMFQSGPNQVQVVTRSMGLNQAIFHYVERVNRVFGLFRHYDYIIMSVDGVVPERNVVIDQNSLNRANILNLSFEVANYMNRFPILIMEAVVKGYESAFLQHYNPPANVRYFVRVELETFSEDGLSQHFSGSIPFCQENYNLYRPRGEDLIQYWMEHNHEFYLTWTNLAVFTCGLIVHYTFVNDIYGPPLPVAPPPLPPPPVVFGGEEEDDDDGGDEPDDPPPPPPRRSTRERRGREFYSPGRSTRTSRAPVATGRGRGRGRGREGGRGRGREAGRGRGRGRGTQPIRSSTSSGGVVFPLPPSVVYAAPPPPAAPAPPLRRSARRPKPRDFYAGSLLGDESTKMFFKQASGYRFTSEAIFECPDRRTQACVVMAVLRSELTIWTFDDDSQCTGILKSTSNLHPTPPYLVPLYGPAWDVPRDLPFIYWNETEQKSYLNLFQSRKYYDMERQCWLSGAQNESEIIYWEMAALELVSSMEFELEEPVDYNDVYGFLKQFARCFHVGVSVYDLDRRTTRIGIVSPYEKPREWIEAEGELRMVHIVYEQGHMHAVSNLSAFTKHKEREVDLRDFHYCPICDAKTIRALNTRALALAHITECLNLDCFSDGYSYEKTMVRHSSTVPVSKDFTELKKKRKFGVQAASGRLIDMKCRKCQELMESKWAFATHRCEIRVPKTKELPSEKIWVFDIESSQVETTKGVYRHECNCFCVRRAYEDPDAQPSARTFLNELEFLEWLMATPELADTIWIAHNAGSYDMQFILRMLERKEIPYDYVPSPNSKHKMLSLTFSTFRLVDSIRFIPGSLDSIAKAFGLELAKGKFPHLFNTPERQSYIGPLPPLVSLEGEDYWGVKMMRSEKEKSTFLRWYEEQQALYCHCLEGDVCNCTLKKWDLRQELVKYCELDVEVLAEIIRLYRDQCLQLDDDYIPDGVVHWKPPRIDPLTCMTLPQLTMKTLLLGYGEEKSPGYAFCRPMTYEPPNRGGMSFKAILWIRQLEKSTGFKIHGRWNSLREYYDWDNESYVDGYCHETNSVYVFLECDYCGCPLCLAEHQGDYHILPGRGLLVEDAYKATEEYVHWLQLRHANCYVMWEHDFELSSFSDYEIECAKLMNPQDAFYGGRTEVFSLYADVSKFPNQSIKYHDVTSLYPSVYAHHTLPMGQPVFYLGSDIDVARLHPDHSMAYFGYVRCHIRPHSADHIGVLPCRSDDGRLTFPVCPMKGVWFTKEIHIALSLGYVLLDIYEVIHWDASERSDQHLKGYVGYFLRMKQEAEGWKKLGASSDTPTEEEKSRVSEALYHQNGQLGRIRHDRVEPNPIKRQLAKLYLNALWGKFAQRPSAQGHLYLYGDRQFFQFWHDHRIDHQHTSFRIMYPGVYQAYYQYKPQFCQPVGHANVFIAAAVTAGARTVLHQRLLKIQAHKLTDHLGDCYPRILYCDTDSVIFMWPNDAEELTSVGLGHWTDEYPDTPIASFFALAPKVYALLFETGKQATKAKGVQLTLANQTKLSMEAISPLLQECARTGCLMTGPIVPKKIQLDNFNIYSNSTSRVQGYATMFSRYNYKDMRIIITKRKIHEDTQFEVGVSSMLYTEPLRE